MLIWAVDTCTRNNFYPALRLGFACSQQKAKDKQLQSEVPMYKANLLLLHAKCLLVGFLFRGNSNEKNPSQWCPGHFKWKGAWQDLQTKLLKTALPLPEAERVAKLQLKPEPAVQASQTQRGFTLRSHNRNSLLVYWMQIKSKISTGSISSTAIDEEKTFLSWKLFLKQQKFS